LAFFVFVCELLDTSASVLFLPTLSSQRHLLYVIFTLQQTHKPKKAGTTYCGTLRIGFWQGCCENGTRQLNLEKFHDRSG
jgi:hypothetical protein